MDYTKMNIESEPTTQNSVHLALSTPYSQSVLSIT